MPPRPVGGRPGGPGGPGGARRPPAVPARAPGPVAAAGAAPAVPAAVAARRRRRRWRRPASGHGPVASRRPRSQRHPGRVRPARRAALARSQVEEAAPSGIRQHAGAGDRRRVDPARQRPGHPAVAGRLAERLRRQDRGEPGLARPGAVPPRRDGDRHPVGQRRDAPAARRRAQLQRPGGLPGGRGPGAARGVRHRVRRGRGRGRRPGGPAAGGHRHGSRRPRQDQAAGRDQEHQRGGARGRRHHPAHRCLPGRHRGGRPGPQDHVHRHPGSRGVHRHACPRRARRRTWSCSWWRPTTASSRRPPRR